MKRIFTLSLSLLVAGSAFGAAFTSGDLVVFTVGNGSSLAGTAMSGALYEYDTVTANQASPVQTIAMPNPFVLGGSASAEGFLKLSTDGNYLTMFGYNAAVGSAAPSGTTGAVDPRVVARIDRAGNINTTTALTDPTGSARSAISTDGTSIWTTTSSSGSRYATLGGTTSVGLIGGNLRVANIYNGQLYVSTAAAGVLGVATIGTGLPTTTSQIMTELPGMPTTGTHSSYDFFFKDANTLYVADDGTAANSGGIQKWTLSAGTWSLSYTLLNTGTATTGCRGLTGMVDGSGNVELFATTSALSTANTLIEVIDTGVNTSTFTTLATAPTGDAFRGVAFLTQIPEPSSFALAGLGLLALAISRRARR